jgi:hypothetical protein
MGDWGKGVSRGDAEGAENGESFADFSLVECDILLVGARNLNG